MSNARKLLIVDDDDALRDALKDQFSLHEEFVVSDAATATAGIMGFGHHHRIHHKGLFGIADDRPVTVIALDEETTLRTAARAIRRC